MKQLVLVILFFSVKLVFAQNFTDPEDLRQDTERYKSVDPLKMRSLSNQIKDDPNGVIRETNKALNQFYLSDPSQKKIQQEQDIQSVYSQAYEYGVKREWNVNQNRLFMKRLSETSQKAFLSG